MRKIKFGIVMALCLTLSLGILTGCGKKPKDAKELLEFNQEATQESEYVKVDMTGSVDIGMGFSKEIQKQLEQMNMSDMSIPVTFSGTVESTKDVAKGNMKMDMNFMGQSESQNADFYVDMKSDPTVIYSKAGDSETWFKSENDGNAIDEQKIKDFMNKYIGYAEMTEDDNSYIATVDLTKIDSKEIAASLKELTGENAEDAMKALDEYKDMIKDAKLESGVLKATYDKKSFLMTSVKIENVKASGTADMSLMGLGKVKLSLSANSDMTCSYEGNEVSIPDDVISGAKSE